MQGIRGKEEGRDYFSRSCRDRHCFSRCLQTRKEKGGKKKRKKKGNSFRIPLLQSLRLIQRKAKTKKEREKKEKGGNTYSMSASARYCSLTRTFKPSITHADFGKRGKRGKEKGKGEDFDLALSIQAPLLPNGTGAHPVYRACSEYRRGKKIELSESRLLLRR